MKRAIVLSGGGSKGAYQIGVWKALRKLDMDYDIVTGTSIGALNGGFFVMKDYRRALELWYFVDYNKILDEKINDSYDNKKGRRQIIKKYVKGALTGGMSVTAMEQTVDNLLDVDKFFESNVDYGLVTVKFPSMRPTIMTKKDLTKENVADYLIASASCFPAFKIKKINNSNFIDGGYYDNMPINLAIDMGADEVIAVDLSAIGNTQKIKNKNIPVTIITPRNDIGNFLVIEKKHARRAINLGYNDAMKVFKKLDGNCYTFKKNHLTKLFEKYNNSLTINLNKVITINSNNELISKIANKTLYKRILHGSIKIEDFTSIIDETAKILELDDEKIYNYALFNHLLKRSFNNIDIDAKAVKKIIKSGKVTELLDRKIIVKYISSLLTRNEKGKLSIYNLAILFPKEFLSAVYLNTILGNNND